MVLLWLVTVCPVHGQMLTVGSLFTPLRESPCQGSEIAPGALSFFQSQWLVHGRHSYTLWPMVDREHVHFPYAKATHRQPQKGVSSPSLTSVFLGLGDRLPSPGSPKFGGFHIKFWISPFTHFKNPFSTSHSLEPLDEVLKSFEADLSL